MKESFPDRLRRKFWTVVLGVDPKEVRRHVMFASVNIRAVGRFVSTLIAIAKATRTDLEGVKTSMATQEERLQQHLELLKTIGEGVGTITSITTTLRDKNENPAINDELDRMDAAAQGIATQINNFLNPQPATGAPVTSATGEAVGAPVTSATGEAVGAPVTSATGEAVPVNQGNQHMVIGGAIDGAQTLSEPASHSGPTSPVSSPSETTSAPAENSAPASPSETTTNAPTETLGTATGVSSTGAGSAAVQDPVSSGGPSGAPLEPASLDPRVLQSANEQASASGTAVASETTAAPAVAGTEALGT